MKIPEGLSEHQHSSRLFAVNKTESSFTIFTWPFLLLFVLLMVIAYLIFMYVDYLIFTSAFINEISYQAIVTSSWVFAISTISIFLFLKFLFSNSYRRKVTKFNNLNQFQVVDALPVDASTQISPNQVEIIEANNQMEQVNVIKNDGADESSLIVNIKNQSEPTANPSLVPSNEINGTPTQTLEISANFSNLINVINETLLPKGFAQTQAFEFVSLMVFSRLLILSEHDLQSDFIEAITRFFASDGLMIEASSLSESIDQQSHITSVLTNAKANPSIPHFIHLHHADPTLLPKILGKFAIYTRFPNQSRTIMIQNESFTIPNNLWFLVTLKPGTFVFSLSEKLKIHAGYFMIKGEKSTDKNESISSKYPIKYQFDWIQASRIFSPTYEASKLPEELWKKMDQWINLMHQINAFTLPNDINVHFENYILVGLELNLDPLVVLDYGLSSCLLINSLSRAKPIAYHKDHDLERFFEGTFGRKTFTNSIALIKQYLEIDLG